MNSNVNNECYICGQSCEVLDVTIKQRLFHTKAALQKDFEEVIFHVGCFRYNPKTEMVGIDITKISGFADYANNEDLQHIAQ